ncbi:MAG TPA: hypothetical protein VGP26_21490 [Actinophytocola sp.]|jgi:hypothetical protein|nr:hypothetical protein [Actinophytocola sp.]
MGQYDRERSPAGPVLQVLAEAGRFVCGILGLVVMTFLAALVGGSGVALLGWTALLVPIGVVGGALAGNAAQSAARNRLVAMPAEPARAVIPAYGLRRYGRWERFYEACARSVATYHEVVATVPHGAGRNWLANIGTTLDAELAEALRLAQLGESLEPDELTTPGETVYKVLERLRSAMSSFAETTERAAAIALDLRHDSNFVQVRAQLDTLAEQVPQLRATGL